MSFARHGPRQQLRRLSPYFPRLGTMTTYPRCALIPRLRRSTAYFRDGGRKGATASRWCCKAGAHSGPIRRASIRRCTQALHECGIEPDWVSGVSIGAINAAIIAGNVPDQRLSRLRTCWELITDRKIWPFTPDGDVFRKARNATSSWMTMLGGGSPGSSSRVFQVRG